MIEKLKELCDLLGYYKDDLIIREKVIDKIDDYIFSLECAIEILEKIKYKGRSIQNGNIE
jgi:hypothetical protein